MTMTYRIKNLGILSIEGATGKAKGLLEKAKQQLGFVPNMYGAMANEPALYEAYATAYAAFRAECGFTPVEQEVIFLAISRVNGCDYCMAAHSFVADKMSKVPVTVTDAIRDGQLIGDEKLAALAAFTTKMVQSRGRPSDADVAAFVAAGHCNRRSRPGRHCPTPVALPVSIQIQENPPMSRIPNRLARLLAAAALIGTAAAPEANGLVVFDPANYQQNMLSAVHALEGVQNQILQLQNEAAQLLRMDRQLQPLSGSIGPDLQSTLAALRARITEGNSLALKVQETEAGYARLYPTSFADALSRDDVTRAARARWDEAYAGYKRAALLQGQVTEAGESDARLLDQILARSTGAVGSLQAAQAGNELAALHIKQSLQLQTLLAAQARAETSERARTLVAEEQGRAHVKTFLGDGRAYTRGQ